jgi:uncharacterized membrane protein YedE/YeeE
MLVISNEFTLSSAIHAVCGGIVLGIATMFKLRLNGNTLGVSGIVGGLTKPEPLKGAIQECSFQNALTAANFIAFVDSTERLSFLAGLLSAGLVLNVIYPVCLGQALRPMLAQGWGRIFRVLVSGFLVGAGSAIGSGCTSGHGISGNSRLSKRSIVATMTFMATGIAAASISESFTWISGESKLNAVELPNYSILDGVCAVVLAILSLVALTSVLPTVGSGETDDFVGFRRRVIDALVGLAFGIGKKIFS